MVVLLGDKRIMAIEDNEYYSDVVEFLMRFPFNTSQIGFDYLIHTIIKVLDLNRQTLKLNQEVYNVLAEGFNVTPKKFEKSIRDVLVTLSNNCANCKDLAYPNELLKNMFLAPTSKAFIYAVAAYILLHHKTSSVPKTTE